MDSNMSLSEIKERIDKIKGKIEEDSSLKEWHGVDKFLLISHILLIIGIMLTLGVGIDVVILLLIMGGVNWANIYVKFYVYSELLDYEKELHQLQNLKKEKKKHIKEQSKTNTQLESILDHLSQLSKDELKIAEMVIKEYTKPEDPVQKISTVTSILTQAEYGLDPDEITVESEKNKEFSLKR